MAQTDDTPPPQEPAASWEEISSIVPWELNPRDNDNAVPGVCESIKEFGFGAPLVVHLGTRKVIAGHTRLRAAQELQMAYVPVRFLDIPEDKAHKLALVDNKLGEVADWNMSKLSAIIQDMASDEDSLASMVSMGFEQDELAKMLSVETGGFLDSFTDGIEAAPVVPKHAPDNVYGEYLTFSVKLSPKDDLRLQTALRRAKKLYGVRTNVEALLAMADDVGEVE